MMNLLPHNKSKLEHYMKQYRMEHASDYLFNTTKQCIRGVVLAPDMYSTVGTTRVGGDPDLPPHIEWPLTSDGIPMTFLTQLDLSVLTTHDENNWLPTSGLLLFFIGVDEPAYNIEHKVLFLTPTELIAATRRISPPETTLEETYDGYTVETRASLDPPNFAYADYDIIEDTDDDEATEDDYEDFQYAIYESKPGKYDTFQMFAYPDGQHDDAEIEAALMLTTGKEYDYSSERAMKQMIAAYDGDQAKAEQEVADILLLLQLDSDNTVGFCWWDAGALQFYIRKEDLLAQTFDRTYCSLYSS